jgi:hypothetical protein
MSNLKARRMKNQNKCLISNGYKSTIYFLMRIVTLNINSQVLSLSLEFCLICVSKKQNNKTL